MTTRALSLVAMMLAAACSPTPPPAPLKLAEMPSLDGAAMLADIKRLSSDEFEGRAPGTKGEALSVDFIVDRFKAAGVEPGNPDGTWTQKVPLVGITPSKIVAAHGVSEAARTQSLLGRTNRSSRSARA